MSGFIHTDKGSRSSLLFNQTPSFFSSEIESPNTINTIVGSGIYDGKKRYSVRYSSPKGSLTGRQAATLESAVSDAKSGERSNSTTYIIDRYWAGVDISKYDSDPDFKGGNKIMQGDLPTMTLTGCKGGSVTATYSHGGTQHATYDFFINQSSRYKLVDNTEVCDTDNGGDNGDNGDTGDNGDDDSDIETLTEDVTVVESTKPGLPMAVMIGIPVVILAVVALSMKK